MTDPISSTPDSFPPSRRRVSTLAILVGLQFLGYFAVWLQAHALPNSANFRYTQILVPTGWYGPHTTYGSWVGQHAMVERWLDTAIVRNTLMGGGLGLACASYLGSLIFIRKTSFTLSLRSILLSTAFISLPMLLLPQLLSGDIWSYILYGRVAVLHGGNPLINVPAAYPQDPFLPRLFWKNTPSVYGPVWVLVCMLLTRASEWCGGSPTTYLLFFKLCVLLTHLANAVVIGRILKLIRPNGVTWGTLLYVWNPLCIVEFNGSGHNDCFMLLLLLIGIWCVAEGRRNTAVGWFTAAGLTKLTGLLGLPAYLLWSGRRADGRGWKTVALQLAIAGGLSAAFYLPFWDGPATFDGTLHAANLRLLSHSFASGIDNLIEARLSHGKPIDHSVDYLPSPHSMPARVRAAVRAGSMACFLAIYVRLSLRRIRGLDHWLETLISVDLAYLLFAAYQFNIWYAAWLVPLTALLRAPSWLLIVAPLILLSFYFSTTHSGLAVLYLMPLLYLLVLRLCTSRAAVFSETG